MQIRAAVLIRDRYTCQDCGCVSPSLEVDHKVRLADGGTDDFDNLQSLCKDCHANKTAREDGKKRIRKVGPDGYPVPPA